MRINPSQFGERFPTYRYIRRTAKHVFAVIEGVVYYTDPPDVFRRIYGVWRVDGVDHYERTAPGHARVPR
jgi:hypothetical protein